MPDKETLQQETRYERERGEAIKSFLRRFRHEISTPLSGANLHLEVALRRMQKPGGFDPAAVVENLRTCQQSLENASAMLELIADVSREEAEEPSTFSLSAAVARAAEPFRDEALERGLILELPGSGPSPQRFGSAREVELVVTELTRNAVKHSSPPGSIRWTIDGKPPEIVLTCRSSGRIPAGDSEHLFGVAKGPGSSGRGFGLIRARRAAQSNGGELTLHQEGDEVCAILRFPGAGTMKILVVEDDAATRKGLEQLLADSHADTRTVGTIEKARAVLEDFSANLCIVDLQLPDGNGLDFIREARALDSTREFIVLTGHGSIDTAVEAMKAGAADYLLKPLNPTQIGVVLEKLSEKMDLEREVEDLRSQLARTGRFGAMVGKSAPMQDIFGIIARVAKSDAPVMIIGESGTGKEIAAATIHELSRRRAKPFVAINCGAISPSLIESELFGHERGSFTGADKRRQGYFELAHGGTLFFDEVTEMSAELQIKLLRVLETKSFRRVGGNEELKVNTRILSSTNRDLQEAIKSKKLREDFYYRLNVFPIALPPLRERAEDIPLLARHFLEKIEEREKAGFRDFEPGALAALNRHSWPGNVRELRNIVHRAYVMSNPPAIGESAVHSVLGPPAVKPARGSEKSSPAKAPKKKPRASRRAGARG